MDNTDLKAEGEGMMVLLWTSEVLSSIPGFQNKRGKCRVLPLAAKEVGEQKEMMCLQKHPQAWIISSALLGAMECTK